MLRTWGPLCWAIATVAVARTPTATAAFTKAISPPRPALREAHSNARSPPFARCRPNGERRCLLIPASAGLELLHGAHDASTIAASGRVQCVLVLLGHRRRRVVRFADHKAPSSVEVSERTVFEV